MFRSLKRRFYSICLLIIILVFFWDRKKIYSSQKTSTHSSNPVLNAIVVPFTSWESERILLNFEYWNAYPPCESSYIQLDLIFYFHKDFTRGSGHLIKMFREGIRKNENVTRCFNDVKFLNADLYDSEDRYPESASRMFFKLFKLRLMTEYNSFFYMEADVLPCKSGWIDSLLKEFSIHGKFWMRGSIIRGSDKHTGNSLFAPHINGNALYAIGDPEFRSFITDVIEPNFWKNPDSYLGGYDVALYMIRLDRSIVSWDFFT
jgi:hypothetical protein